jgi:sigma-54 dependent transcriptional regulator, acetoin dehydrogenase operon transcriptional activator AcoR
VSTDRQTLTDGDTSTRSESQSHPSLILALACDRPASAPRRWRLSSVTEVVLSGAGSAAAADAGTLVIACNDPWASSRHAALRRSFGRWLLEDLGSKNGTTVNGDRISRHQLCDGDLIETGHTAWWFRELAHEPALDSAADLGERFVTLHAPLELAAGRAVDAITAGLPVLVVGETGVGKERFVEAIHAATRRPGALVAVNCAALPAALVEGELFGHRRGAFSGAVDERAGYLRAADRGTVFLDEVGDMPPAAQAALLRAVAERKVTPVGDERPIAIDVAVVSATHRDLDAMASAGTFRADLLARLRGITVRIPPLRERREDIGVFIARTLARAAPDAVLTVEAARQLLTADWPLNVRELEHVIAAAALRAGRRAICPDDLEGMPVAPRAGPRPPTARSPEDDALRARLVEALAAHGGNISAVARQLGRDRKQIHRWIARLAIDLRDPR